MGLCSLVTRRDGIYTFRKRIPEDLQAILGRKTIKKSLGTSDPNEAKQRRAIEEAHVMELFRAKRAEANGEVYTPLAISITSGTSVSVAAISAQSNALAKGKERTIQAIFDKWAEHKKRSNKNADVAVGRYQQKLNAFKECCGNILIGDITLDTLLEFRDHLSRTTKHKGKTINGYLTAIHALASFALNERYISSHPFAGAKYKANEDDSESWIPFERDDIERLFLNPDYKNFKNTAPPQFWMPLVSLFTGARIEEIAQLKQQDVKEERGIYYFDINERGKDKRVKTKSSIRKVPVHPELRRLGLLEYVKGIKEADSFIFPDLVPCENRRSHNVSTWFGEYRREVGVTDPLKVFHSFRHSLINACRAAKIPQDMHMQLAGHKDSSVHGKYGYPHHVTNLYPELCKVDYGVDFASLHVCEFTAAEERVAVPVTSHVKQRAQASSKELLCAVSLMEAYQRLGKASYGNEWADYDVCFQTEGKWVKTNLRGKLRPNHKKQPELPFLEMRDLHSVNLVPASDAEVYKHKAVFQYFEKGITKGHDKPDVRSYRRVKGSNDYEVVELDDWGAMRLELYDLLFSICRAQSGKTVWQMLVNTASLDEYLKAFS